MRVLAVIQRYGRGFIGGAERSCAELSERLVGRGHTVEVLTSHASTYGDWQVGFATGLSVENGVTVHRLPVETRMDRATFEPFNQRVIGAALQGRHVPMLAQCEWLQMLGPVMLGLDAWVDDNIDRFDVICVHTLGYWHASATIGAVVGRRPVVLHPLAHDEPNLTLPVFDTALLGADAFAFLTPEERLLVEGRTRPSRRPSAVIGLGVDPDTPASTAARVAVRGRLGLADVDPFVLCAGRVDRDKGVHALAAAWEEAHRRGVDLPLLVVAGEIVHELVSSAKVHVTGPLPRAELTAAMAASIALVHPSVFESFAIVLTEAWAQGTPTLVNAACDVLAGQCRRSGGGLAWHNLAELHEQITALRSSPPLRATLGARGQRYVQEALRWDDVLDRYETLLASVVHDELRGRMPLGAASDTKVRAC